MESKTARGRRKPASKRARQPGRKAAQTATQVTTQLTEAALAQIRGVVGEVLAEHDDDPILIGVDTVCKLTSMSASTIRRLVGKGEFPKPIQLPGNRQAWVKSRVLAWNRGRIAADPGAA